MSDNDLIILFQSIGLSEQRAKDTAKNKKLAPTLQTTIVEAGVNETGCDKSVGALLYTLASTITKDANSHLSYIARAIIDKRLKSADQIAGKLFLDLFPHARYQASNIENLIFSLNGEGLNSRYKVCRECGRRIS